jgi:hypothetical protein
MWYRLEFSVRWRSETGTTFFTFVRLPSTGPPPPPSTTVSVYNLTRPSQSIVNQMIGCTAGIPVPVRSLYVVICASLIFSLACFLSGRHRIRHQFQHPSQHLSQHLSQHHFQRHHQRHHQLLFRKCFIFDSPAK